MRSMENVIESDRISQHVKETRFSISMGKTYFILYNKYLEKWNFVK